MSAAPPVRAEKVADTITLDHGERHRRRVALTADNGLAFLLDLAQASVLEDGDAVRLEDGRLVAREGRRPSGWWRSGLKIRCGC